MPTNRYPGPQFALVLIPPAVAHCIVTVATMLFGDNDPDDAVTPRTVASPDEGPDHVITAAGVAAVPPAVLDPPAPNSPATHGIHVSRVAYARAPIVTAVDTISVPSGPMMPAPASTGAAARTAPRTYSPVVIGSKYACAEIGTANTSTPAITAVAPARATRPSTTNLHLV